MSDKVRQEARSLMQRQPKPNDFSTWQMNFPHKMPSGLRCPISALGECGDPKCPTYRPRHPEVREAVERTIIEKCVDYFRKEGSLQTYASVGCGLLGQDWIILEKLRQAGLRPRRAIFIELRTAQPVMTCEGSDFPRSTLNGGMNLRQTGFNGPLGPEFAFSAIIQFAQPTRPSVLFDFSNGPDEDSIFVEVGGPNELGLLTFGCYVDGEKFTLPLEDSWEPGSEAHTYLFTIGATGVLKAYIDGEMVAAAEARPPRTAPRRHLFVGQSSHRSESSFAGRVMKIKVWDQEVDFFATDMMYASEVESAVSQFTQWYAGEVAVWTFGSLASYAAAVEKDRRFAADLLMKVDVHDELDGYDDFVCQALGPEGLALTLGGPGRSWCRRGGGWCPVDTKCQILDDAEAKHRMPWAFMGAFPGDEDRQYFTEARPSYRAECALPRRAAGTRRPQRAIHRRPRRGINQPPVTATAPCCGRQGGAEHGDREAVKITLCKPKAQKSSNGKNEAIPSLDELLADLDEGDEDSLLADIDAVDMEAV